MQDVIGYYLHTNSNGSVCVNSNMFSHATRNRRVPNCWRMCTFSPNRDGHGCIEQLQHVGIHTDRKPELRIMKGRRDEEDSQDRNYDDDGSLRWNVCAIESSSCRRVYLFFRILGSGVKFVNCFAIDFYATRSIPLLFQFFN